MERKYRKFITIGIIKSLGMTLGELAQLKDLSTMDMDKLVLLINSMMIEGEPVTDDTNFQVLRDILPKIGASLTEGRQEATKEPVKPSSIEP